MLFVYSGTFNLLILGVFLAFFLPSLFIILVSPKFPNTGIRLADKVISIANGWHTIRNNRKIVFVVSIIAFSQLIIAALGTLLSYNILGIHIGLLKALFLSSISLLGIVVSITPSSLGVAEAISVFSATILNIAPAQSLAVAIIGRVIGTVTIFILGPIYSYLLIKHKPAEIKDGH